MVEVNRLHVATDNGARKPTKKQYRPMVYSPPSVSLGKMRQRLPRKGTEAENLRYALELLEEFKWMGNALKPYVRQLEAEGKVAEVCAIDDAIRSLVRPVQPHMPFIKRRILRDFQDKQWSRWSDDMKAVGLI